MTQDIQTAANASAVSYIATMRLQLAALKHAQDGCAITEEENDCRCGKDSERPEAWHDEDEARQWIDETPLSIEVRDGWRSPSADAEVDANPEEFKILLGTGGPAAQIRGEFGVAMRQENIRFEYQDWFQPWTRAELSDGDQEVLESWVGEHWLGE